MIIDGHTRVCGLLGDPVEHTSSPAIHNTLADITGHNLVYLPFRVARGNVADVVKGAFAMNILGLNVTVPHKLEVIESLVAIDDLAAKIGAVNTLVRSENGFKGYNTDILGLERALLRANMDLKGKTVVVLGAGGAARAAAFLTDRMQAAKVYIFNRSVDKAIELAAEVNASAKRELVYADSIDNYMNIPENDLIVLQATSIGLSPNDDQAVIENEDFYKKVSCGYDLVYRPAKTKFMKLIEKCGGRSANGLGMLLYQGIIAYELWNDVKISEEDAEIVYKALEESVRK